MSVRLFYRTIHDLQVVGKGDVMLLTAACVSLIGKGFWIDQ